MLELVDVSVRLGGRRVLQEVSQTARAGEVLPICGADGAGKSTLLKAVLGEVPATGVVRLNGLKVAQTRPATQARMAFLVFGTLAAVGSPADARQQGLRLPDRARPCAEHGTPCCHGPAAERPRRSTNTRKALGGASVAGSPQRTERPPSARHQRPLPISCSVSEEISGAACAGRSGPMVFRQTAAAGCPPRSARRPDPAHTVPSSLPRCLSLAGGTHTP